MAYKPPIFKYRRSPVPKGVDPVLVRYLDAELRKIEDVIEELVTREEEKETRLSKLGSAVRSEMTPLEYIDAHQMVWIIGPGGFPITEDLVLWEAPGIEASVNFSEPQPGLIRPFFHLQVDHPVWSVGLFRLCQRKWAEWLPTWPFWPMLTMADRDNDALDRLRTHFGFKFVTEIPCTDGRTRRLYAHLGPAK